MSIQAMSWVFSQDIRPSSIKFVLLALADSANGYSGEDHGVVWPSIAALSEKTSQDRKTVIAALDSLEAMGLLSDTGKRVGTTAQVKVYRIVGLPSDQVHYTYKLTHRETGEFYVGVRSCEFAAHEDVKYMGSGKWPMAQKPGTIEKEVLAIYKTRVEAEAAELALIAEASRDPLCQNIASRGKAVLFKNGVKQSHISAERVPETEAKSTESGTRNRKESEVNHFALSLELEQPVDVISPEVIYSAYPRKKNPPKALAAIARALRKVPAPQLLAAVQLYAAAVRKWPPGDDVYIPYPASWFNAEAWLDDPKTWERNSNDKTNRAGTSRALGANSNLDAFDSFEKRLATGA